MSDELPRIDEYNVRMTALDMAQKAFLCTIGEPMPSSDAVIERAESYLGFLLTGKAPDASKK